MKKRLLALILTLALVLSMLPAGALAADMSDTADKDKYVTLDGDWHFKLYRKYNQMYQYLPYGMCRVIWENNAIAGVPSEATFSKWETFQMPADDDTTGGLLPQARPVVAAAASEGALLNAAAEEEEIPTIEEETPTAEEETPVEEEAPAAEEETPAEEEETPAEEETPVEEEEAPAAEEEAPVEEEEAPAAEEETPAEEEEAPAEEEEIVAMIEEEEEDDGSDPSWLFPVWSEAWVCRTFDVPANFTEDEEVTLLLGTIDDVDVVYVNGKAVASSGFADASGNPILNDRELGGFDYSAGSSKPVRFDKSYWEIGREYKIPASVLKEGKNSIQIRVFNNNSLGGFYSGKIYALCGNQYAVRNLKGLPADKADSESLSKAISDQIAAIEANDMAAFAATVSDSYANDADDKAAYVASMTEMLKDKTDIQVTDTDALYLQGADVLVYTANRTITAGGEVICSGKIEQSYLEANGIALERGNWSHCYTTGYTSELFNGETLTYSVYLPPSYYTDTNKEYPVVYLLHGQNSSSTSYINVDGIEGFMDNLINSGKIMEMILVMPDSGKNAFYRDSALSASDPNHNDSGPWASTFITELVPTAESNYRIIKDARYRGMTGNSMGGGGSFYLGCSHPELFSSIASHMGYLPQSNTAALEALTDEQLAQYDFYLDCGLQDTTVGTGNTIRVHNYLESKGIEHYYELRDGIHGSAFYMGSMDKSMAWHSAHFSKARNNVVKASDITVTASSDKQTAAICATTKGGELVYSSNSKKVTVNKDGVVTINPNFVGSALITVSTDGGADYDAASTTVTVTVEKASSNLSAADITLKASGKKQSAAIAVSRLGAGKMTFTSDTSAVSVNGSGKVTVAPNFTGSAIITIEAAASGIYEGATTQITVTVNP